MAEYLQSYAFCGETPLSCAQRGSNRNHNWTGLIFVRQHHYLMQPTQVLSTTSSFLAKQRCLTALLMDSAADAVTSAATLPWHRQPRRQRRLRDVIHQDKCKLSLAVTECNCQLGLTQMNHECEEIVGERY